MVDWRWPCHVFLRKLEYYKGILILTTNLIDCIDEAFESRISYPLQFHELSRDDRHQIWTDFIKNMNTLPAHKMNLLNEVDRWSEAEINGRQIRNVILRRRILLQVTKSILDLCLITSMTSWALRLSSLTTIGVMRQGRRRSSWQVHLIRRLWWKYFHKRHIIRT